MYAITETECNNATEATFEIEQVSTNNTCISAPRRQVSYRNIQPLLLSVARVRLVP